MSVVRDRWSLALAAATLLLVGLAISVGAGSQGAAGVLVAIGCAAAIVAVARDAATGAARRRRPAAGSSASRAACVAGGGVMLAGLALGLADASSTLAAEISLAGLAGSVVVVTPGLVAGARHFGPSVLRAAFVLVGIALVVGAAVLAHALVSWLWPIVAVVMLAAGGLVLLADTLGASLRRTGGTEPGWRLITGGPGGRRVPIARGVSGTLMIMAAAGLGVALAGAHSSGQPWLVAVVAVGIVLAVLVAVGTPLLVASVTDRRRREIERLRDADRQRVSAHLHDSVLQTLALVQRQAGDAEAVARLARRQEHALRAWMAGETELTASTLAGALRDVALEIEEESHIVVELSAIGDRATGEGDDALLAAAREALRNVARHAPGSAANVLAQIDARRVAIYISDEGPGFVPAEVPAARRGIRDSIVGRMAAADGDAEIRSRLGYGTEVVLRLPKS